MWRISQEHRKSTLLDLRGTIEPHGVQTLEKCRATGRKEAEKEGKEKEEWHMVYMYKEFRRNILHAILHEALLTERTGAAVQKI